MFSLLGETPLWVMNSFPTIRLIIMILLFVAAVVIIVLALCQKTEGSNGTNAITGANESYYSQNKGQSLDGKLRKYTIILSIFIAVAVVVYFILTSIYNG